MAPTSRGSTVPAGLQSKSTPNLPTLRSLASLEPSSSSHGGHETFPSTQTGAPSAGDYFLDGAQETNFVDSPSDSDREEQENESPRLRPLYTSRSATQLPRQAPSSGLFPPFYNRPPVPLPPSPSLTSLLRPSFSNAPSRPSTPDSSDIDIPNRNLSNGSGGTSTPNLASITKSARHAPTVPRASPKVPTYEYYGFALYLASGAAFLMYVLWAYVPSPLLHQMGIHYYPNRWWALAVPSWLVVLVIYIYVALASYNTKYLTLPLSSRENLVDECGQVAVVDRRTKKIVRDPVGEMSSKRGGQGKKGDAVRGRNDDFEAYQFSDEEEVDWNALWSTGTDAVLDVPIGGVCEILYGAGRERQ